LFSKRFPDGSYADVNGVCRVATVAEVESQGWSLNPGRYVGTEIEDLEDEVFEEKLAAAHLELRELASRAAELEASVDSVLAQLLSR
jgi:type I restriction enzyme M protein